MKEAIKWESLMEKENISGKEGIFTREISLMD